MAEPPDIILLSVDALRADHVSGLGYDRETTPALDAFADAAVRYTDAYAPSSHTREAAPPLLTGRWPEAFVGNNFQQVPDTLPSRLADSGYQTGAFHSNPYLSRAYGYDDGFDAFDDDLYLARNRFLALAQKALDKYVFNRGEYYARAEKIHQRALSWLDGIDDGPVFLWNHYMDVHGPYHAPETHYADRSLSAGEAETLYRKAWERPEDITDEEQQLLIDSYDDEIRCLDAEIGAFLDALDDRGRLDDALVVITADHGEVFGEYGQYTHPRQLRTELLHVPLVLSPPGGAEATVTAPVSTIDVAPTASALAGVDADLPGAVIADTDGSLSLSEDRHVFASVAPEDDETRRRFAVTDGETLLRQERDLDTNDILEETVSGTDESPSALRDSLAAFAHDRLAELGRIDPAAQPETTDEIESRLEALGYK
ncbi:sulfatase-like hydrolase/transferase [Halapricum sp. CBA1109]|uniref:sulfatase n=1 Tax=Halapricum sp. CBA1109 TaxID=2668068 RepID=UPI0012FAA34B|nr:sulfatase [Halapricum sp. CBA1109]MUV88825.1 sulfatase-like hydrolase/transferase [Halapricum sp. CBA1109]